MRPAAGWQLTLVLALLPVAGLIRPAPAAAQIGMPPDARPTITATLSYDTVQPGTQAVIAVVVEVPANHYAQADTENNRDAGLIPLSVSATVPDDWTAFETILPEPSERKDIPTLGSVDILKNRFVAYVPVEVGPGADAGDANLSVSVQYQICNTSGLCYPPATEDLTLDIAVAEQAKPSADTGAFAGFDPAVWATLRPASATTEASPGTEDDVAERGVLLSLLAAFGAGIIFNIVPCVLPVLPLKIMGFFEAAKHDRAKCVSLALFFAVGMVAVFALLGVPLFVTNQLAWGELFSRPWFSAAIAVVLLIAAVGTFGAFSVNLPTKVYAFAPRHDTALGNIQWGAFTAILSTPCTFGLFAGVLLWAAAQSPWLGVLTLVVTGLGMAFPYVLLSFFPELARKMPRAGAWGEIVKQGTAFVLLAVAAFFAKPLLPASVNGPWWWWVVFGLLAAGGLWVVLRGGIASHWRPQPVLIAAAVVAALLIPAGIVAADFANPPAGWVDYTEVALADARTGEGPVIVEFTADWCLNCKTVERQVFGSQEAVDRWRDDFGATLVKVDLTSQDAPGWPLLRSFGVSGIPFTAVYLPGREAPVRLPGIYNTADLEAALRQE